MDLDGLFYRKSHPGDDPHLLESLPRQAQDQRVELRLGQRQRRGLTGGVKGHEAVVHEEPDARGAGVGEELAVVGVRSAEDLHDAAGCRCG